VATEAYRIEIPVVVEDQTDPGASNATKKVNAFDKAIQQTQERLDKLSRGKFQVALEAIDKVSSVVSTIGGAIKGIAGKAWRITMGVIDKATAPLRGILNILKNPILQAGAVLGISVGLKDTIDTFSSFQATMSKVEAISGATSSQMEELNAKAKEMGATTKFTASEAGEAFTYMAMAGWKTEDMLGGIEGIMSLAAASGESLATTSDIVTDALTAFGMTASESGHFADVLAVASSNANTNVAMMGETFKYVGAASGSLGYSIEDVALGIGLMANSGIKASQAGTELNSIFTRLSTNTNGARDAIEEMGISFYTSTGDARAFGDVLGDLREATKGMTKEQKMNFANTVAGQRAQAGLLAMLNATTEDYNKLTEAVNNCEGAAAAMADTMMDNLAGDMTYLQSAVEGVKISIGERLSPYMRQFVQFITSKMPDVQNAAEKALDFIDDKISWLSDTINEFMSGDDWANADIWGKIKIAWEKIVAEPFSEWWNSTGKAKVTEIVGDLGQTIGSGITAGLLALLGIDVGGALEDGKSIGASFLDGFKSGLDLEQIGAAFTEWAGDHKGIVAAAGVILGGKLIGGVSSGIQKAQGVIGTIQGIFGKGGGATGAAGALGAMGSSYTTATMNVQAGVVNISGGLGGAAGRAAANAAGAAGRGLPALPSAAGAAGAAGAGAPPALPGAAGAGGAAAAGGLISAGGWLGRLLQVGSKSSVVGADGTLLAVNGGIGGTLGSVGGALGSGATTAAGAAAAGTAAVGGGLLGGAGIISGLVDIYKGTKAEGKEAQTAYATGGSKIGMVGAGAAAGAAIGSVVPVVGTGVGALVGAGVGGLGALFGGDKAGQALSDSLDEGGALNNLWQSVKTGASEAWESVKGGAAAAGGFVSEKWDALKEGAASIGASVSEKWNQASDVVSEKWSQLSNWFGENVWTPISDAGISAINIATGVWLSIAEPIKEAWGELTGWFSETVWEPIKEGAAAAGQWINDRWTEAKTWASETWEAFSGWFEESVWNPIKEGAQTASAWIGERWNEAKATVSEAWQSFSGWFDETIWGPVQEGAAAAGEWVSTKWNEAKTFVSEAWQSFSSWFDESVWTPVQEGARAAGEWIGTKMSDAKNAIQTAWEGLSGWFGESVWGPIKSAASDAWGFVKEKWQGIKDFASGAVTSIGNWASGMGEKGSQSTGLTTSKGKSTVLAHADGGIMTQPHMGLVAEAGAESIIPLSPSKRGRGIELWEQTGQALGVKPYEDGGVVGNTAEAYVPITPGGDRDGDGGNGGAKIEVNVELNPQFVIGGQERGMDENAIVTIIRAHIREMADDMGDEIAERLARAFSNMPVKGGV